LAGRSNFAVGKKAPHENPLRLPVARLIAWMRYERAKADQAQGHRRAMRRPAGADAGRAGVDEAPMYAARAAGIEVDMAEKAERCEACGEIVPIGGWPFCASGRNPDGHRKGTYGWVMGGGALNKWTHTGSRSPR
jgi:hypothetical protein